MADQKKVELILGIKTTGAVDAAASLDSISKVAASLGGELSKLERADVLKQLGATAAQVGADIGNLDQAAERLAAELKAIGATEAEIRKVSTAFDKTTFSIEKSRVAQEKLGAAMAKDVVGGLEKARAAQEKLGAAMAKDAEKAAAATKTVTKETVTLAGSLEKISRQDAITKLATKFGEQAKKTKDATAAANELNEALKRINAAEDEIQGAAGTFAQAKGESGGSIGTQLTRLGAQGRNLPSMQIPGAGGLGTDAVSNVVRLSGALLDVAGKSDLVTAATKALTPALGAEAAATYGALVPAAAFVAAFGAIAIALSSLTAATGQNAEAITAYAEAQRGLNADIVEGLTTTEAQKKLEDLNESRRLEEELLAKNKAAYEAFEKQATDAGTSIDDFGSTLSKIVFGANAVGDVAKVISADEQAIADNIATSEKNIASFSASADTLTVALDSGRLAANDAAEAEKKLADERSKAALSTADNAAKTLQAEQKALAATEEQNNARLTAIDNEKAVAQAQIDSLTASGVTSEEVTAKIKALNEQLGLLGQESSFIKDTALAVSKQNDAAKKAKKDQEDADKKAQQAQEQYTKAVQSAAVSYRQSLQDIGTRLTQALSDNTLKFNRDLTNIATKYRRDEYDLTIKAQRAERDALLDQQDDLKSIRADANKDEAAALQDGDFKLLFLARQKRDESLKQEEETLDLSRQKRERSFRDAQEDLLRNAQRQRQDRMMGFEQQNYDTRTAQQRELAQARLTQERALQAASQAQSAGLGQIQNYWNKFLSIQQQGMNNSLKMAAGQGAGPNGSRATGPGAFAPGSFVANTVGRIFVK